MVNHHKLTTSRLSCKQGSRHAAPSATRYTCAACERTRSSAAQHYPRRSAARTRERSSPAACASCSIQARSAHRRDRSRRRSMLERLLGEQRRARLSRAIRRCSCAWATRLLPRVIEPEDADDVDRQAYRVRNRDEGRLRSSATSSVTHRRTTPRTSTTSTSISGAGRSGRCSRTAMPAARHRQLHHCVELSAAGRASPAMRRRCVEAFDELWRSSTPPRPPTERSSPATHGVEPPPPGQASCGSTPSTARSPGSW